MQHDIEATVESESNVRVSVSKFDADVWLHLAGRGFTAYTVLNVDQATVIRDGLTAIIEGAKK